MPYVAYYRVSTQQQGKSGLGLAAQQQMVKGFVKEEVVLGEFVEVESGKTARPQLRAAWFGSRMRVPMRRIARPRP